MKLQKAIKQRRSQREFKSVKVDWRDVLDCLDLTRYSPMAGGYFSLNYLIVNDKELISKISEFAEQDFVKGAGTLVVFVSDPSIVKNLYGERGIVYMHQQAGAAAQNFMLALTDRGISTCWVGHFNEEKVGKLLKIPGSKVIEAIFPIGYAKNKPKTRQIMAELYNRIYYNEWGNKRMNPPKHVEHYAPEGYW